MNDFKEVEDDKTIDVGKQIRTLREQRKLSQRALAEGSGISRNHAEYDRTGIDFANC